MNAPNRCPTTVFDSSSGPVEEPDRTEQARHEALWKIGRNTIRFQKMEAILKSLCLICSHFDIAKLREKPDIHRDKRTMGQLAGTFAKAAYRADERPPPTGKPTIRFNLIPNESLGTGKARLEALTAVVEGRNRLIHRWLVNFDQESATKCEQLVAKLDAQWAHTQDECDLLVSIWRDVREGLIDLHAYFQSDQFEEDLRRAREG